MPHSKKIFFQIKTTLEKHSMASSFILSSLMLILFLFLFLFPPKLSEKFCCFALLWPKASREKIIVKNQHIVRNAPKLRHILSVHSDTYGCLAKGIQYFQYGDVIGIAAEYNSRVV
jgi:hypothetical protein